MTTQERTRDAFLATLNHLDAVITKIGGLLGPAGALTFPDHHKLTEGLFLSAWTHWEEFIRLLLIDDLAESPTGFVRKDVRQFRVRGAPRRIAERVLFHPDHPDKFVEWDFDNVKSRANNFLPVGHRFTNALPRADDLAKLKRIRNAIAHKSDRAWESFRTLVAGQPFNLTPLQRRGLTTGRFLCAHQWNAHSVMAESIVIHRAHAAHLVP